MTPPKLQ